jgi:class 3 adenylate cyclase
MACGAAMTTTTVTLLFSDLVGSTELSTRVGDERSEQLRREHFGILRDALREYGGREVKNLGDGLMIAFDAPTNALGCAGEIQQRLEMRNRVADEPLVVRIGVSTGEANEEHGDYFGGPAVEGARLCAHAEGAEILTTHVVRALVGTRSGLVFDEVGAITLKGLDEPVLAFRVAWRTARGGAWQAALPPRLSASPAGLFVGRASERGLLADASAEAVAQRRRRVVLLEGEAGIGKTALVTAMARDAHDGGAVVLYGHCDEDLAIPYQAWAEALADLVDCAPEPLLRAHLEARGGDLISLVPTVRDRVGDAPAPRSSDVEAERHLLFGAVVDLLRRASAQAPLILALDDLHWADGATVQLLRHVVGASVALPMLVVATYRGSDIDSTHPLADLLAALHREDGVLRISLHGLDDKDLLRMMERAAGHEMDDQGRRLRDELLAETDGNPFFVIEVLRHLAETAAIERRPDGRWVTNVDVRAHGLPVSVREVVGRRVTALGPLSERVLSVAAVIGRDFDLPLVREASGTESDVLLDVIDGATNAALVRENPERPDGYTFVHALIQRSLYDALSPARRRREHERVAEALEALPGWEQRIGELARHWNEAVQPTSSAKAFEYAFAAGDDARRRLAPDEAVRWFTQALDLAAQTETPDVARADALLRLGEAQRLAGKPEYRATLLDAAALARTLGDGERVALAALSNTRGFVSVVGEVDRERIDALQAALAMVGSSSPSTRARLLAQLSIETQYAPDVDTQAIIDEALELTAGTDDDDARAAALRAFHLYFVPSTLQRRLATLDEYHRLETGGDALRRARMAMSVVPVFLQSARLDDFSAELERLRVAAEELGDPTALWVHSWLAHIEAMSDGDVTRAEALSTQALQYGMDAGQPDAFVFYGAQLITIRTAQGRGPEVRETLAAASDSAPGIPVLRAGLANSHAITGDVERARTILDEWCAADDEELFAESPLRLATLATLGSAAIRCGHAEIARVLIPFLAPYRDQMVYAGVAVQGPVALSLGYCELLVGDDAAAEADFAHAVALTEGAGLPCFTAITKLEWARFQVPRGDVARARALIAEVRQLTAQHGYAELWARAAELEASLPA